MFYNKFSSRAIYNFIGKFHEKNKADQKSAERRDRAAWLCLGQRLRTSYVTVAPLKKTSVAKCELWALGLAAHPFPFIFFRQLTFSAIGCIHHGRVGGLNQVNVFTWSHSLEQPSVSGVRKTTHCCLTRQEKSRVTLGTWYLVVFLLKLPLGNLTRRSGERRLIRFFSRCIAVF